MITADFGFVLRVQLVLQQRLSASPLRLNPLQRGFALLLEARVCKRLRKNVQQKWTRIRWKIRPTVALLCHCEANLPRFLAAISATAIRFLHPVLP